jgi:predicted permease
MQFRRLFRIPARTPARVSAELREEIEAHIALAVDQLVARGMEPAKALQRARARFANLDRQTAAIEASAQRRSTTVRRRELLRTVLRDLEFAVRQAKRAPIFTLGVILSLGFGIGASTTVYSWMQGIILHPLPAVRDVDRLITVRPEKKLGFGASLDEYTEWRAQTQTVSDLAASSLTMFAMETEPGRQRGAANPIFGQWVSSNYFDVLGVPVAHGRAFVPSDDQPGAEPVAVISHVAWMTRLGGDSDAVGRVVQLNGKPIRIIGVTRADFGGSLAVARLDIWVPLHVLPILMPSEAGIWRRRDYRYLDAIGRLKPGATLAQAQADFRAIGRRQAATFPENAGRDADAMVLDKGEAMALEPLFFALMSVTGLVVLLICSNVANLLLVRAAARSRELGVRLSLGASRRRLVGQLLTESTGLAAIGALIGAAMAIAGQKVLPLLVPQTGVGLQVPLQLDVRFVLFVVGVTATSVIAFGLAPALIGSRINVVETLKDGGRGSANSRSRVRSGLVVAQFVFALTTLVVTALFLRRDRAVHEMDLGFRGGEQVLLLQTEIAMAGVHDAKEWDRKITRSMDEMKQIPGVRSVAVGSFVPLGIYGYWRKTVATPARPLINSAPERVYVNGVTTGYFDLMGIHVLDGRPITDDDIPGRAPVAVVNQAFADEYFPPGSVVGKSFALDGKDHLIVGVVSNGRYDYRAIDEMNMPMVYFAWRQAPSMLVNFHVRTEGNPMALAPAATAAIQRVDASIPLLAPLTLQDWVEVPFVVWRTAVGVFGILATAALALASMGLFSLISYGVTLRTREVGIRIALGATQASVMGLFLRGALRLVAVGAVAGMAASAVLVTMVRTRVPTLPAAVVSEFAVPVVILGVAAIAAGLIPALRAASVDPATTLRSD